MQPLYHYTDFHGLHGIATSRQLWCTQMLYLNDSTDSFIGLNLLSRIFKDRVKTLGFDHDFPDVLDTHKQTGGFTCSFSEAGDLLSQWRAYAGGGGVSIEFDPNKLNENAGRHGFRLEKCIYDGREQVYLTEKFVDEYLEKVDRALCANSIFYPMVSAFMPIAARFKDRAFIEEQEWRLIAAGGVKTVKVRATAKRLIPYTTFDLNREPIEGETLEDICMTMVSVGPHPEQELQMNAIMQLFLGGGVSGGMTGCSTVPYRNW